MHPILTLLAIALVVVGIQLSTRYWRSRRLVQWMKRGMVAYQAKRFDEALRAFRKCVRIAPEWLYARTLLSISLAQSGEKEQALDEIRMVEALQPRETETWALISMFYAVCMPDNAEPLVDALERVMALDLRAARDLLEHPAFARARKAPQVQALQERIAASAAVSTSNP